MRLDAPYAADGSAAGRLGAIRSRRWRRATGHGPSSLVDGATADAAPCLGIPAAAPRSARRCQQLDCPEAIRRRGPDGRGGVALQRGLRLALLLLGMTTTARAAGKKPTPWVDVCEAEDYIKYRPELCPDVFFVSSLAFDPLYPKSPANVTIIIQPSKTLYSTFAVNQKITIKMPDFEPYARANQYDAMLRDLQLWGNNPAKLGQDPAKGYNTYENPLFQSPAIWDTRTNTITMIVKPGPSSALLSQNDTEVRLCCLRLPEASPKDSTKFMIAGPTTQATAIHDEPVMRTPFLDPGFQFDFLQVLFDPPMSKHLAVINLILRSATPLGNRNRIILHLPNINREPPISGVIDFNTAASADATDWMLFAHEAIWDNDRHTITFFLRAGSTLPAGKQVTLRTNPNEFRLPVEIKSNWEKLQVEVRSFDDIDMVIRPTPISQGSRVPHVREFIVSELKYHNNRPYGMSIVEFTFMTNRPMFAGTTMWIRLSGFQAEVVDVFLIGPTGRHFQNGRARFDLPANMIELKVNKTFYSNERNFTVIMADLFLPPATYENDKSLLVKTSDSVAQWQHIDSSPPIGPGTKTFIQSQLLFSPMEPRMPANITFIVKPSIIFYQGDVIVFHLYSFLYGGTSVPLVGPKAHYIKNSAARWTAEKHMLEFVVADNELILNTEPFEVTILQSENFRLPDKLSKNDGICRIEGRGALIEMEPMRKTPKIGADKFVIMSRLELEPIDNGVLSDSVARIVFKLILNTDVLPNSTLYIKLGGLKREVPNRPWLQSGMVRLSGSNAPLFTGGMGDWNSETNFLTVKIVHDVQIYSGERIRFFLERDQYFKLPYAMYPSDPSFRIKIPEAGISERPFNFSTRVSQDTKAFPISFMFYGETASSVVYPNDVVDITIKFRPNVMIPQGSMVRLTLPGFSCPLSTVPIGSPEVQVRGEAYLRDTIGSGNWNQMFYTLDMFIPVPKYISRFVLSVMKLTKASAGFRLPKSALAPNDQRLKIEVIQNQIIYPEPIKKSPRVVSRSFAVSNIQYLPPIQESICQLVMYLQPTVNITDKNDIVVTLWLFRRIDSLQGKNVHLIGPSRSLIKDSMAQWNQSNFEMTLKVPDDAVIPAFSMVELRVAEAQGFILPAALRANDTRIRIRSKGLILDDAVKQSRMVGNGPYRGHLFCMRQFERGVRTLEGLCDVNRYCQDPNPPFEDPCSEVQLRKCGCPPMTESPVNITVKGFELQPGDQLSFIPWKDLCGVNTGKKKGTLSAFSPPQKIFMSPNNSWMSFENISSVDSGYYRICMVHVGQVYDVGKIVVRPSCQSPLVLVDGVCVNDCPKTQVPIAGDCLRDPNSMMPEERQALMLPITIDDPDQKRDLANAPTDDPERKYFKYRFVYDLASLLNCDSKRIIISSLSNGSVIINTIFTPAVPEGEAVTITDERSPLGLVTLFKALQSDTSSSMYSANSLFKDVVRDYTPEPIKVRQCEDGEYRVFCPFLETSISQSGATYLWYWLGTLFITLILMGLCATVWYIDAERQNEIDEDKIEKLLKDPKQVEPEFRLEFARSWMEGRFMGERWQKARAKKMLAIT